MFGLAVVADAVEESGADLVGIFGFDYHVEEVERGGDSEEEIGRADMKKEDWREHHRCWSHCSILT